MDEALRYRLAQANVDDGRPLEALDLLRPIEQELTGTSAGLLLLGRAYYHSAQLERAERTLARLVELDPTDAYARFLLGRTLERLSRLPEALTQYRLAASMADDPEYHDRLALVAARVSQAT